MERRWAALVAVTAVAALALGGCGDRSGDTAAPSASGAQELRPVPAPERPPVPDGYRSETVSAVWVLDGVDPDDRTLVVRVATGSCMRFDHLTLEQVDAERLLLSAWNEAWVPTRDGFGCDDDRRVERHRVPLSEPVAGRRVEGGRPDAFPGS